MRHLCFLLLVPGLLAGCDAPATKSKPATTPAAPAPVAATLPLAQKLPPASDSAVFALDWEPPQRADTLLTLGGQRYRLRLESAMDSTKGLATNVESTPGSPERAFGYAGTLTFTLRDSLNRLVFRRELRKPDFYRPIGEIVVVQSGLGLPTLLGYSVPLGALIFTVGFSVPGTDWGGETVLLLDLKGRVLRMAAGDSYGGGPDCHPKLSADGRTLLTSDQILRAYQPPILLDKPHATLAGACLLTDSTALTVYEPGRWQKVRTRAGALVDSLVLSPAQPTAPNAFVLNTRTGRVLSRFRYTGYFEGMGYIVPRKYLAATHTLYLIDDQQGLWPLPLNNPTIAPAKIPFPAMTRFGSPQRPAEVKFELETLRHYAFYVDSLAPRQIRYQVRTGE